MSVPCVEETPARVIFNPASGGGAWTPQELRALLGDRRLDWVRTEHLGDAREAAREWRGLLMVAGGDGTLNDAVHGIGLAGFPEDVTLALLSTGTRTPVWGFAPPADGGTPKKNPAPAMAQARAPRYPRAAPEGEGTVR